MKIRLNQVFWMANKYLPIIPTIISITAVIVALLPFYYQHIRINNDVKATILNFLIDRHKDSRFVSEIVFINNGNQPCTIVEVLVSMENIDASNGSIIKRGKIISRSIKQNAFTITPREVITKQFLIGSKNGFEFKSYGKIA